MLKVWTDRHILSVLVLQSWGGGEGGADCFRHKTATNSPRVWNDVNSCVLNVQHCVCTRSS